MAAPELMIDSTFETTGGRGTAGPSRRLDDEAKARIDRLFRRGTAAGLLAAEYGVTLSRIDRVVNEKRARRLLDQKLDYMPNPSFEDPGLASEILAAMPGLTEGKVSKRSKAPDDLPPYLASLYDVPLLTREQEAHLFRKMNYLKFRASRLRDRLDPSRPRAADLDEIERFQAEALSVKNQIIRANLRLVVSIAKKHLGASNNFFELVSDGNISLIRAVEKFDYDRGNKFSTYASWAIMRNFIRSIPEEKSRRDRFVTGHEEMFEAAADTRTDEREYERLQKRNRETVHGLLDRLNDRERRIIASRFGLEGAVEQTLEQLGQELGVTKERVRQIEARAQEKLRKLAVEERLEIPNS